MKPKTQPNLTIAMQSEALAHAKYSRFAARARMDGEWELARTSKILRILIARSILPKKPN